MPCLTPNGYIAVGNFRAGPSWPGWTGPALGTGTARAGRGPPLTDPSLAQGLAGPGRGLARVLLGSDRARSSISRARMSCRAGLAHLTPLETT